MSHEEFQYIPRINDQSRKIVEKRVKEFQMEHIQLNENLEFYCEEEKMDRSPSNKSRSKFDQLYDDSKHRNYRKKHMYKSPLDEECTFKPKLCTPPKNSNLQRYMSPPFRQIRINNFALKRGSIDPNYSSHSPLAACKSAKVLRTSSKKRRFNLQEFTVQKSKKNDDFKENLSM